MLAIIYIYCFEYFQPYIAALIKMSSVDYLFLLFDL